MAQLFIALFLFYTCPDVWLFHQTLPCENQPCCSKEEKARRRATR